MGQDFRIERAAQLLQKNPSCKLTELAGYCHVSISRLSHLFKDETGLSVKNYRRNCRLQKAVKMLVLTDTPIKEIAYRLGYHHTSSFVRAFKAQFKLSPTRYRESQNTTKVA